MYFVAVETNTGHITQVPTDVAIHVKNLNKSIVLVAYKISVHG